MSTTTDRMRAGTKRRISNHRLDAILTQVHETQSEGDDMALNRWLVMQLVDELREHRRTLANLSVIVRIAGAIEAQAHVESADRQRTYGKAAKLF